MFNRKLEKLAIKTIENEIKYNLKKKKKGS